MSQPVQPTSSKPLIEVTLAILYREGGFLMQLRDDLPTIVHPGIWGFFGGHIEPGEAPEQGLLRELAEEITYRPERVTFFADETHERSDAYVRRHYFYGELTVPVSDLVLNEGQDLALCSPSEIRSGEKFSQKLGEARVLGQHHRQMLLNFLESDLL